MNIQFSNWKSINLQALDSGITSALTEFQTIYSNFDATNFEFTTVTNTKVTGISGDYNVVVLGNDFTTDVPFETYKSISLINSINTAEKLLTTGDIKYTYPPNFDPLLEGTFSGYYNKLSYVSNNTTGLTNLLIEGRFDVNALGDTIGGTASKYNVTFAGNTINLSGSIVLDANDDITGGTISSFTFADNQGRTLTASGLSISATEFYRLTDPNPPNSFLTLDEFYDFLTNESNLTGNDVITGSVSDAQDDILNGYGGNDTLSGGGGNDTIDGGAGVDKLIGGLGDDTYTVDLIKLTPTSTTVALQDTVTEAVNAGTDNIILRGGTITTTATTLLTLAATIEDLDASGTGTTKLNITGNTLANTITGNDADNILLGLTGDDTLNGEAGNDTLDGGIGLDTLVGGDDNDTYLVDAKIIAGTIQTTFDDTITETALGGIDTLKMRGSTTLAQPLDVAAFAAANNNIEGLDISLLTGNAKINLLGDANDNILVGNAAVNTITGDFGDDILDGKAGADVLNGGAGDDTYFVDVIRAANGTGGDVIDEDDDSLNFGNDTAKTTFSANLSLDQFNGIENLTLLGTGALSATGDEGNNELNGNDGGNLIDGGTGADEMDGGKGADTYIVDNPDDDVSEQFTAAQGGGVDLVKSSVSYSLGANIENLTMTGTDNISVNGNELNNILTGNIGNNTFDARGGGIDTLIGGKGNDIYYTSLMQTGSGATAKVSLEDNIIELAGLNEGYDIIELDASNFALANPSNIILGANIEAIYANGTLTTKLNFTGNSLDNVIYGNEADNIIDGGAGSDMLGGGGGNDTYLIDLKTLGSGATAYAIIEDGISDDFSGIDTIKLRGNANTIGISSLDLIGGYIDIENLDASATGTTRLNLTGNDANNILIGNAAVNTLTGGDGDDTLNGGAGLDVLIGGQGNDTYIVDSLAEANAIVDGDGENTLNIGLAYTLTNTSPFTNITLTGAGAVSVTGNDIGNTLIGNAAANILNGGAGEDELFGGAGADTLNGGADNDTIIGGIGNDILTGGLGVDTFKWELADKGTNGRPAIDKITDFSIAQNDVLDLRDLLVGESQANIANYLDIITNAAGTSTEIRISNTGGFAGGTFAAAAENQHITLTGVNLFTETGTIDDATLLATLIAQNKLIID